MLIPGCDRGSGVVRCHSKPPGTPTAARGGCVLYVLYRAPRPGVITGSPASDSAFGSVYVVLGGHPLHADTLERGGSQSVLFMARRCTSYCDSQHADFNHLVQYLYGGVGEPGGFENFRIMARGGQTCAIQFAFPGWQGDMCMIARSKGGGGRATHSSRNSTGRLFLFKSSRPTDAANAPRRVTGATELASMGCEPC